MASFHVWVSICVTVYPPNKPMVSTSFVIRDNSQRLSASVLLTEVFALDGTLRGVEVSVALDNLAFGDVAGIFFDVAGDRTSRVRSITGTTDTVVVDSKLSQLGDTVNNVGNTSVRGASTDTGFDIGVKVASGTKAISGINGRPSTKTFFVEGISLSSLVGEEFAVRLESTEGSKSPQIDPLVGVAAAPFSIEPLSANRSSVNSLQMNAATGTVLTFRQRPARLEMEALENGNLIERVSGQQNGVVPGAGSFEIFAIDSADSGNRSNFVDRTFFDRGEGIGITDGEDGNNSRKKRIDGDEKLVIKVDEFTAKTALVELARIQSSGGALIRVEAFDGNSLVDSEVFNLGILPPGGTLPPSGTVSLNFLSDAAFDTLHISAAGNNTQFTFRSLELLDAQPASGTLLIDSFEFKFQNPDAPAIADKILTSRIFEGNETALLIPELGKSFTQLLTLTAQGGAVEDETFELIVANPFVDITKVTVQGNPLNIRQSDNGERQVTIVDLPDLDEGEEIVLTITSTVTNNGVTSTPLKEFDFGFQLEDAPGNSDLGNAVFEGKIYTSARYFDTTLGSAQYVLNQIENYLITANIGTASNSLDAKVVTLAGNLAEGTGGKVPGKIHTLYALDLEGQVNPLTRRRSTTTYYSDAVTVQDWQLNWEPRPGVDISAFVNASGSAGFPLWESLIEQGIFSSQTATTVGKNGSLSQFSTGTFTQKAIGGNIINAEEPPPLLDTVDLTFGQDGTQLRTKATQDGHVIEIVHGRQNHPTPGAGPFDIFAVNSPDSISFVDRTWFDQGESTGIKDGDDGSTFLQKRIDGDEILGLSVDGFIGRDAQVTIDRLTSTDGARIRVEAYRSHTSGLKLVDAEIFEFGSTSHSLQVLDFTSAGLFDTLHISAADSDTRFTFRSVALSAFEL